MHTSNQLAMFICAADTHKCIHEFLTMLWSWFKMATIISRILRGAILLIEKCDASWREMYYIYNHKSGCYPLDEQAYAKNDNK